MLVSEGGRSGANELVLGKDAFDLNVVAGRYDVLYRERVQGVVTSTITINVASRSRAIRNTR